MQQRIGHALNEGERRGFTAFEVIQCGFLFWWGVALWITFRGAARQTALYLRMAQIAPLWVWIAASFLMFTLFVVGIATARRLPLYVGLLASACYFAALTAITWDVSHSLLTPSFIAIYPIGTIVRYAKLKTEHLK